MQRLLQFTLDLFETTPELPAAPAPGKPRAGKKAAGPCVQPDKKNALPPAEFEGPNLPAQTIQQALAPATFRHPRATRETLLDGILVGYEFRRGKRRTIGFSVG